MSTLTAEEENRDNGWKRGKEGRFQVWGLRCVRTRERTQLHHHRLRFSSRNQRVLREFSRLCSRKSFVCCLPFCLFCFMSPKILFSLFMNVKPSLVDMHEPCFEFVLWKVGESKKSRQLCIFCTKNLMNMVRGSVLDDNWWYKDLIFFDVSRMVESFIADWNLLLLYEVASFQSIRNCRHYLPICMSTRLFCFLLSAISLGPSDSVSLCFKVCLPMV